MHAHHVSHLQAVKKKSGQVGEGCHIFQLPCFIDLEFCNIQGFGLVQEEFVFPQQQLRQPRTACGERDKGVVYRLHLQGREIGVSPAHRLVEGCVSELNLYRHMAKGWYKELSMKEGGGGEVQRTGDGRKKRERGEKERGIGTI